MSIMQTIADEARAALEAKQAEERAAFEASLPQQLHEQARGKLAELASALEAKRNEVNVLQDEYNAAATEVEQLDQNQG